jgi:hypothetical protein
MKIQSSPEIICRELPPFNASDLDAVRAAFQSVEACPLQQAWRPVFDAGFEPTQVRAGWRGHSLLLLVEVTDSHIYTRATDHNQPFWELGDTIEVFLSPLEQASYVELQVTPNNFRLQLRFAHPDELAHLRQTRSVDRVATRDHAFRSQTWVEPENNRWFVFVEIPAGLVGENPALSAGSKWLFSFCRYEYAAPQDEPVLSSTSAHAEPDFHQPDEWGILQFKL